MNMPDSIPANVIDIRLSEIGQLFNTLDPSPFHERDLDADAEEHIVGWARELPSHAGLELRLHLPREEAAKARERDVGQAVCNYFGARAEWEASELRELFRRGWHYLPIGLLVLAACLTLSQLVKHTLAEWPLSNVLAEGLVILGWVANWKPLEIFLYDWWPLKRRRDLYMRLQAAKVDVVER